MHARNRTWALGSDPAERCRQRTLPVEGGDGSTLSLDFTTGVLDPRLTFTRGTNATFINSSGLVEWAAANMFRNTVWGSTSLPTGWLANASNTGTVTYNGNGTITCAATSQIAWIYPDFPYIVTQTGLSYICSFRVVSISGPTLITDILSTGNFTAADYFINGVSVGASPSAPSGNVTGPCVVSVRVNATSTSWFPRLGVGVQGLNRTATITMSEPHSHPGTVPVPYLANTSTSASNHNTPRFDHDPTAIGTPRGLLIEGSATNLLFYSQDVTQASKWTIQTAYASISATGGTAPDNTNTGNLCTESTGSAARSIYQAISPAAGTYTVSVWAKAGTGSARFIRLVLSSAIGNFVYVTVNIANGAVTQPATAVGTASAASATVTPYTGSWYKISLTGTLAAAANFIFIVPTDSGTASVNTADYGRYTYTGDGSSFLIWGAQLEQAAGASSYVPSAASQGVRGRETLSMTGSALTTLLSQAPNGFSMLVSWTPRFVSTLSGATRYPAVAYLVKQGAATMSGTGAFWYQIGNYTIGWNAGNGTVQQDTYAPSSQANDLLRKMAWSFTNGAQLFSTNGATISGKTLAITNYDMNILAIGHSGSATDDGSSEGTRHYSSYKFFPTALSQTDINNLTT